MASIIQNSAKQAPSNLVSYSSNTTTIHRFVKETLFPGLNTIRRVSLQVHENSKFQNFNYYYYLFIYLFIYLFFYLFFFFYGGSLEQIPYSKLVRLGVTPGLIFMSGWRKISEPIVGR